MRIELTDTDLDYLYKLLMTRPMGEVEPLVVKLRQQVYNAQHPDTPPPASPELRAVANE